MGINTILIGIVFFSLLIFYFFLLKNKFKNKIFDLNKIIEELTKLNEILEEKNRDLEELNKKFKIESFTDSLTGLANRRFFMNECEKIIANTTKEKTAFFIIILDIDYFKKINDTYGHLFGDVALKHVAQILKSSLREGDIVARFGGEEFIIGLPKTNIVTAKSIAERIRITIMNSKVKSDKNTPRMTISIGISQYISHEKNIETSIKRADDALYKAKSDGRNCIVVKL
jgi:diguanylate cyclase (GGDEF)-like protein